MVVDGVDVTDFHERRLTEYRLQRVGFILLFVNPSPPLITRKQRNYGRSRICKMKRQNGRLALMLLPLILLAACTGEAAGQGSVTQPISTSLPEKTPSPSPTFTPTTAPTVAPSPLVGTTPRSISSSADLRVARQLTLTDHGETVTSLAYSPDGAWLASGSSDDVVRLWDVAAGQLFAELEGHSDDVRSVAFSTQGDRLASASEDGTVRIWSVPDGGLIDIIDGLLERVYRVGYSSDGSLLALAGNRCTVEVRDARYGILQRTLTRPGCTDRSGWATSWGLAFAPGSSSLAAGQGRPCCGGTIYLWQLDVEISAQRLPHQGAVVTDLAFSPDGSILAVATSVAAIRLWGVEDMSVRDTLEGHIYAVNSVSFTPDGQLLASGSRDQTVRIWDLGDGRLLTTLEEHKGSVEAVVFSPDGSVLASGSQDGTIILWGTKD